MHRIRDLHFEQEILPLFDFTCNEFSRNLLIELLSVTPDSLDKVLLRQSTLKALLQHPLLFRPFSYHRMELHEVYHDTLHNRNRTIVLSENRVNMYWPFSSIKSQQERGKLLQIISFFFRIRSAYFSFLNEDLFPDSFRSSLTVIEEIFDTLEVEKYYPATRKKMLSVADQIKLMRILDEQVRTGKMEVFWNAFFLFEAYVSIAKGIRRHEFIFPEFTGARLSLVDFYHPLIKEPVKNTLTVYTNVVLLTGPNMPGKSTLLRSIGVCVYLAHLGLAVPARTCELMFFDSISVAIDLNDDLPSGYSHFMSEVASLKEVVVQARNGKKCFAIFDELFRGTNNDDALKISYTTIAGLTQFTHSCFFISTHLHELKEKLDSMNAISLKHIDCSLIDDKMVFTYTLKEGWSELKIGQTIFENEGLNELLRYK